MSRKTTWFTFRIFLMMTTRMRKMKRSVLNSERYAPVQNYFYYLGFDKKKPNNRGRPDLSFFQPENNISLTSSAVADVSSFSEVTAGSSVVSFSDGGSAASSVGLSSLPTLVDKFNPN